MLIIKLCQNLKYLRAKYLLMTSQNLKLLLLLHFYLNYLLINYIPFHLFVKYIYFYLNFYFNFFRPLIVLHLDNQFFF